MNNASQNTEATETKTLSITDDNISQKDFERLRAGEKVEVEAKSETVAQDAIVESEDDESETSQIDGDEETDDESELSSKDQSGQKKPARGFKKRIDKLNARLTEKEREIEHWKQQALRDQKSQEKLEEKTATSNVSAQGEPNPDDYETAADFYKAHAKFVIQEEQKAAKEAERQEKFRLEAESKKTAFHGRVEEFEKAHDDFHEMIADVDDIMMSPAVSQIILESDNGPELMYELAKNREEYARICALPPFEAARALGRFESRLQKPSEEKTQPIKTKTTKAPPPPKPISTSSANGKKSIYDDDVPQKEYERMRAEQEKRRASNY